MSAGSNGIVTAPVERVLHSLKGVKRSGEQWVAQCPAHDDRKASLAVRIGEQDGRAVLHCHAGCEPEDVVGAIGLKMSDLFVKSSNGNGKRRTVTYTYTDEAGQPLFYRDRVEWFEHGELQKEVYPRQLDGKKRGTAPVPYRLHQIKRAIGEGSPVVFVEGEKPADALAEHGYIATTTGSATSWHPRFTNHFRGARVVLWPDADDPGEKYIAAVAANLHTVAAEVRVVRFAGQRKGWDAADYFAEGGTTDQLDALFSDAPEYTSSSDFGDNAEPDRSATSQAAPADIAKTDIRVGPNLEAVVNQAVECIADRPHLGVFVRGRMLVTIERDGSEPSTWLKRPPGAPVITPVDSVYAREILARGACWWSPRKSREGVQWEQTLPPAWVANHVVARRRWPLRYLEAVIEVPTLRANGSILSAPGWDEETGLLYDPIPGQSWPRVPDHPTEQEVEQAVRALLDPVIDFPFLGESDRAAYVAALLTLVARHCIDGPAPMFSVRAPTPGTGKTLLADMIGLIGTGRSAAAMTLPYDGDELRKRITSIAIAGTPLVLLDNVSGTIGSDVLAGALTAEVWEDRVLGVSTMVRVPLRTVWLTTGNNTAFKRTLGRRVVPIDLDSGIEQPEDRTGFQHADVRAHVRAQRPRLIQAALLLLHAFCAAGRPKHGGSRMGSFERWDDLIRSAVIWAQLADPAPSEDPASGRGRIREEADDDTEGLAVLLEALFRIYKTEPFTVTDVLTKSRDDDALRLAVDTAAAPSGRRGKTGAATAASIGATFRQAKNRPLGGVMLARRKRTWLIAKAK